MGKMILEHNLQPTTKNYCMWNGYDTNVNVDMYVDRHHMFSSHWTIEVSIGGNVAATAKSQHCIRANSWCKANLREFGTQNVP